MTDKSDRRTSRSAGRRAVFAAVVAMLAVLVGVPTAASAADTDDLTPPEGAYFGSILDWGTDTIADQSERLGSPSAVYQYEAAYPLTDTGRTYLANFLGSAAAAGAIPLITLRPTEPLASLDASDGEALVAALKDRVAPSGSGFYLSFAPQMNGSWVGWGQQPAAYRDAFTTLADIVHRDLPAAAMLWSPFWGGDYPYTASRPATGELADADTTGDGILDDADDPYAPYYPGDDSVDAVGLSVYHDDSQGGEPVNTVPSDGELVARLTGTDGSGAPDFAGIYASRDRPLVLETGAFYSAAASGPSELDIKRTWWRQVEDAVTGGAVEALEVVIWRDTTTTRGVVGETVIDWSISGASAGVRDAFDADIRGSGLVLGPVREPVASNQGSAARGNALPAVAGWIVVAVVGALVAGLFARALWRRGRNRLGYDGPPSRDERIDLLRGLAIVFVVVNHVGLISLFQDVTQEFLGIVSGAELFVLLSGAVLGIVYRPKLVSGGIGEVVIRTGQRAWKLYRAALAVVVIVFFLALVPFLNGSVVTTFTDQGTGAAGPGASGRVYDLYSGADRLLDYPVDPHAVVDLLLLRMGPWQFNIMGLYVVLLAVSPLVLWALGRRFWPWVVGVSLLLYVVGLVTRVRLLPSQFEDSFPLLVWQVLFVLGMTAGFYRREIIAWFSTRVGLVVLGIAVATATALMVFSWNNPYVSSSLDTRLALLPDNEFRALYGALFERTYLEPGRLLNVLVLVVALYALLSAYWRPIAAVLGRFLIPLGQATLYVFIMHVFFALAAASIPLLREGNVWIDTAANVVILALLWVMVKTRFLFRIVPR